MAANNSSVELPLVSVMMPIRNEAAFIARSLEAVLAQDYPHSRMEVIIADGLSDDGTPAIIRRVVAQHPEIPVVVIDNPNRIVSTGLNLAVARARGAILVRVDGHCEVMPDYISRCVAYLLAENIAGVGGPIETIGETPVGQAIAAAMGSPFGVGGASFRLPQSTPLFVDTIAFPAYRREAVEQAGPFDEELVRNQDDEYNYRLRELGHKLLLAPDVRAKYYSRSSLPALWRQYFQYGYWKVRVMQKHPPQARLRHIAPPVFVAAIVGGAALALFVPLAGWAWLAILAAYLVANLATSLWAAARAGWRYLLLLPIVFASLHLSYGAGFLVGLVRFANRWLRG